jgi:hypothetical protein
MENQTQKFNAWMPLQKSNDGGFVGILSDDSIDRDGEFMSKQLLNSWVKDSRSLPMLANHENKLEKLIGGWTNKELVTKNGHTALVATPFFLESNPLGVQAKAMVEEALSKGLGIGISIGAIPSGEMVEKEVDGKKFKGFTEAEILEATIVPIQSNRNASFSAMAKSFGLDKSNDNMEEITMAKEIKKESPEEAVPVEEKLAEVEAKAEVEAGEEVAEVVEAVEEEPVVAEEPAPVVEEPVADKAVNSELEQLKKQVEELKKYKEQAVLKGTVEGPTEIKKEVEPTLVNLFKAQYGGQ